MANYPRKSRLADYKSSPEHVPWPGTGGGSQGEINIAEARRWPGTDGATRNKYRGRPSPSPGGQRGRVKRIPHMTIQMAVAGFETLTSLARAGRLGQLQTSFHAGPRCRAAIRRHGAFPVVRVKASRSRRYGRMQLSSLDNQRRQQVPRLRCRFGRGGDVTLLIHKGYELENGDKSGRQRGVREPEEQVIKDLLKRGYAE